jgi:hypothetical protein
MTARGKPAVLALAYFLLGIASLARSQKKGNPSLDNMLNASLNIEPEALEFLGESGE